VLKENINIMKKRTSPLKAFAKANSPIKKISAACKASAKRKYDVWPSAYASGYGVRCTQAGGPSKMGKSKDK
jgi:hypothetical protein